MGRFSTRSPISLLGAIDEQLNAVAIRDRSHALALLGGGDKDARLLSTAEERALRCSTMTT